MHKNILQEFFIHTRQALVFLAFATVLFGFLYTGIITVFAQFFFPYQANGSLLRNENNEVIGSELIGQSFKDNKYFWGRPSSTQSFSYNAAASSASKFALNNPAFAKRFFERLDHLKKTDPKNQHNIPLDLLTSSASGLDPHISQAAAFYQIARIAKERKISEAKLEEMIRKNTKRRTFGFLGEKRVNVLTLNLALDAWSGSKK